MKHTRPLIITPNELTSRARQARHAPTRRRILGWMAGAGLVPLIGCGGGTDEDATEADESGQNAGGSSGADAGTSEGGGGGASSTSWASGGTAAMTAKSTYAASFSDAVSGCALVATTTDGPCTTQDDQEREDISEDWTGLPVRLGIKVVDTSCNPLPGAKVKIWHTNLAGSYSGETPNNGMCLKDQDYSSLDFFRGVQTSDDEGVVYFDTCFPGWYRGRAVHIHFQVKDGATSYRISQLFFPEDLTADIFANHVEYAEYGQPDTTFSNDSIIGEIASGDRSRLLLDVARMSDGAMLASKVVTVAG
jgi:protocatechuate 3,4-dioxygenase beta subunit